MLRVLLRILINGFSLLSSFQYKCKKPIHRILFFLSRTYADFKGKNSLSLVKIPNAFFYFFLTNCKTSSFITFFSKPLIRIQETVSKQYISVLLMLIISNDNNIYASS